MHDLVKNTYPKIKPYIRKTPLEYSPELSRMTGAEVYLKLECQQLTGSFKLRGVVSKVLSLPKSAFEKTFVAASTGNHAAAFSYASQKFGFKARLYLPKNVSPAKLNAIKHYDVERILYGSNSFFTEEKANQDAKENDGVLIHPYNDPYIAAGQGTVAIEIADQLPEVDAIFMSIGGGGLISGVAAYAKHYMEGVKIYGCQPNMAADMLESLKADKIVPPIENDTVSDATAGGIEPGSITFDLTKKYVDKVYGYDESTIKKAIVFLMKHHNLMAEGGAVLSVAAMLEKPENIKGKKVVCVITGKKIVFEKLQKIMSEYGHYY